MATPRVRNIEIYVYSMNGEQLLLYGPNRGIIWQPNTATLILLNANTPYCAMRIDMKNKSFLNMTDYVHASFIVRRFLTYAMSIPSILSSKDVSERRKSEAERDVPVKIVLKVSCEHMTPFNMFRALLTHSNVLRRPE